MGESKWINNICKQIIILLTKSDMKGCSILMHNNNYYYSIILHSFCQLNRFSVTVALYNSTVCFNIFQNFVKLKEAFVRYVVYFI